MKGRLREQICYFTHLNEIICIAKEKKKKEPYHSNTVNFIWKLKEYITKDIFLKNRLLIGISVFLRVPHFKLANS